MEPERPAPEEIAARIAASGLSIYDPIDRGSPLFLDAGAIEALLARALAGTSLDFPLRTRSKVAKDAVCRALGYPVPAKFRRGKPRFPAQDLDVYVQKSHNLQIWNDEIAPERRYALLKLSRDARIVDVKVLCGQVLAKLDRTGKLTSKVQAERISRANSTCLVTNDDTAELINALAPADELDAATLARLAPLGAPERGRVLSVRAIFARLATLIGREVEDPGHDQERSRGGELQRVAASALGLAEFTDAGRFPDVPCQLLELKLQTRATVDLGLVSPDSTDPLELRRELGRELRHCDVRYAVFYGEKRAPGSIAITSLVVTTGEKFFTEFRKFGGLGRNRKLQLALPRDLFSRTAGLGRPIGDEPE